MIAGAIEALRSSGAMAIEAEMTPATYETLKRLVDGLRAQSIESAIMRTLSSPERELEGFLLDLNDTVREEVVALMCLGQEARKNLSYLKGTEARAEDVWRPAPFDTYRVEARRYTFDYFVSKPLHDYLPLALEVVKLYELDTRPQAQRDSAVGEHAPIQLPLFKGRSG